MEAQQHRSKIDCCLALFNTLEYLVKHQELFTHTKHNLDNEVKTVKDKEHQATFSTDCRLIKDHINLYSIYLTNFNPITASLVSSLNSQASSLVISHMTKTVPKLRSMGGTEYKQSKHMNCAANTHFITRTHFSFCAVNLQSFSSQTYIFKIKKISSVPIEQTSHSLCLGLLDRISFQQ